MPRPLEQAVVVITGASSGIGRAAALRLARRGSSLALCARSAARLEQVAGECEATGAAVLAHALDVADEDAVEQLAQSVVERFDRIDAWVNNAGVIAYGDSSRCPLTSSAFSECLRSEIDDEPGIHITTMAPQAVDTPIFNHGANYPGRRIRPIPMLLPEAIAVKADRSSGNVVASSGPHSIDGAWRRQRRSTLRRAFAAACAGALAGLAGAKASAPKERT